MKLQDLVLAVLSIATSDDLPPANGGKRFSTLCGSVMTDRNVHPLDLSSSDKWCTVARREAGGVLVPITNGQFIFSQNLHVLVQLPSGYDHTTLPLVVRRQSAMQSGSTQHGFVWHHARQHTSTLISAYTQTGMMEHTETEGKIKLLVVSIFVVVLHVFIHVLN